MNKIITISRQYASGGRVVGEKLAKEYGIPFYDNELITRAAKESGFAEEAFRAAETKATNSFLYSIAMGMSSFGGREFGTANLSLDDRIYIAQTSIIRKVADEGPCVIVGRCADYVLRDYDNVVHVFLCADMDFRVKRALEWGEIDPKRPEDSIRKIDKRRANYYNYHSCETWGKAENYHLTINTASCGIDNAVKIIKSFIDSCGEIEHGHTPEGNTD
jgi:cytidylate kinase